MEAEGRRHLYQPICTYRGITPTGMAIASHQEVLMKTAINPSLRVCAISASHAAEGDLRDDIGVSGFVESALRAQMQQWTQQAAFLDRGLASPDQAKEPGVYFSSGAMLKKLEARLPKAKKAST
jgi:hypothetical protein